jgi:vancomycin resistance protein YoaR
MKVYWKILYLLLLSLAFCWPFGYAQAAENLEITLEDEGRTQSWQIPTAVVSGWNTQAQLVDSEILQNKSHNLDEYLTQKFNFNKQNSIPTQTRRAYLALADFLRSNVLPELATTKSKNAVWEEQGGRVTKLEPDVPGKSYNIKEIIAQLQKALIEEKTQITIRPLIVPAKVRLVDLNPYGISSLIATGSSNFTGSSNNRIHNIRVGASRYQGHLVPPGATFSFNDLLGPVDGEHGFAPELVIKDNRLIPEFGGGICQVSTTVFRAALNGGLPVTERRNHSFAVSYYAPQGTDATIYPGVQDLKFVNDTDAYIVIWHTIQGTTLTFDFYGKPDGRTVEVANPVRYDVRPNGAFKASLRRTIAYADGQSKEDVFYSNYRPPAEFTQTTTAEEPPAPDPDADTNQESDNIQEQESSEKNNTSSPEEPVNTDQVI